MDFFGNKTEWMFGKTPPDAIVTVPRSLESSSSLRIASWMWRGTTRDFLLSRAGVTREFEHFGAQVFLRPRKTQRFNASVFVHRPDATLARPERSISNFKFQKTTHHDSRQVHRRAGADARRVLASLQVARDPADRELQARLGGSARRLLTRIFPLPRPDIVRVVLCRAPSRALGSPHARARARSKSRVPIGSRDARDESDSSRPSRERGIRTRSYDRSATVRTCGHLGHADDGFVFSPSSRRRRRPENRWRRIVGDDPETRARRESGLVARGARRRRSDERSDVARDALMSTARALATVARGDASRRRADGVVVVVVERRIGFRRTSARARGRGRASARARDARDGDALFWGMRFFGGARGTTTRRRGRAREKKPRPSRSASPSVVERVAEIERDGGRRRGRRSGEGRRACSVEEVRAW